MTIFLLANTYVQHNILDNMELILGIAIKNIIVLKESCYNINEGEVKLGTTIVVDNVKEGIICADIAVIIPYAIPQATVKKVVNMCKEANKQFLLLPVENIYNNLSHSSQMIDCKSSLYCSKKPVVFVMSLGKFSQVTKLQLSINKYFGDRGYHFDQIFSDEFFSDTDDNYLMEGIIQNKIKELEICEQDSDFSIITWPFDLFSSLGLLGKYLEYICPDYCIICVENNFDNQEKISNYFAYKLNISIDKFVFSDYIAVEKNGRANYLYVGNNSGKEYESIDIICSNILTRITYPQGIFPIL